MNDEQKEKVLRFCFALRNEILDIIDKFLDEDDDIDFKLKFSAMSGAIADVLAQVADRVIKDEYFDQKLEYIAQTANSAKNLLRERIYYEKE